MYECPECGKEWIDAENFDSQKPIQIESKFCSKVCEETYHVYEEIGE